MGVRYLGRWVPVWLIVTGVFAGPAASGAPAPETHWSFLAAWPEFRSVPVTRGAPAANTYLYTAEAGVGCVRGVIGDDSDERYLVVPPVHRRSMDSDIVSEWAARTGGSAGQHGHAHRLVAVGRPDQSAVMVWGDAYFGTPFLVNVGVWRGRDRRLRLPEIHVFDLRAVGTDHYPYNVRSRLNGATIRVRAWLRGAPEPTSWQFVRKLEHAPTRTGRVGLLAPSHIAAGQYECYGSAVFRSLVS